MDDSKAQTLRVVKRQADAATGNATPPDTTPWQALQEKLTPCEVVIPWAPTLEALLQVDTLPRDITRLRRDFPRLLTLVKVIALLYQQQRSYDANGRLIATVDDYAMAYALVAEPFARSVHGLSAQAVAVAEAVQQLYDDKRTTKTQKHTEAFITVRDLAKALRWAKRTVQKWVDQAAEADLLDIHSEEKGKAMKIWPAEKHAGYVFMLLPTPEELSTELGMALTAVHPLTGAVFSPVRACAPAEENATTPVMTMGNGRDGAYMDRAQCACQTSADGITLEHTDTCPHAHLVRTLGASPDAVPEDEHHPTALTGAYGGAHAGTVDSISTNGSGVRTMQRYASAHDTATPDTSTGNGDLPPDCARAHREDAYTTLPTTRASERSLSACRVWGDLPAHRRCRAVWALCGGGAL